MNVEPNARIAFQGERGAFSEEAAVKLLGDPDSSSMPHDRHSRRRSRATFLKAWRDYLLAPIENSLAGSVHRSFDLLVDSGLNIHAEEIIPIVHNLIGPTGSAVRRNYGGGIASRGAGCSASNFFSRHPRLKRVATEDTAGKCAGSDAGRRASNARGASRGGARRSFMAERFWREHLEDHVENYTRFWLLSPSTTIGAERREQAIAGIQLGSPSLWGAACTRSKPFANRGINLLKIESRPVHGSPWQYRFYLDLQAARGNKDVEAALEELEKQVVDLRILGSYAAAQMPGGTKG